MSVALLEIEGLTVDLPIAQAMRRVIHDVTLSIHSGEAVGLVGESGSGKSMTARAVMRLLPRGAHVGGQVRVEGASVYALSRRKLLDYRRRGIGMIYQDPRAHINPLRTVGDFLSEGLAEGGEVRPDQRRARAVRVLEEVGIGDASRRLGQYPHELSGGLLQRVMIASVLLAEPKLMLADEPTTALDVTTQQEVMAILDEQRRERDLALLFITHDLDLAIAISDRIAVMYAGTVVETRRRASSIERRFIPTRARSFSRGPESIAPSAWRRSLDARCQPTRRERAASSQAAVRLRRTDAAQHARLAGPSTLTSSRATAPRSSACSRLSAVQ